MSLLHLNSIFSLPPNPLLLTLLTSSASSSFNSSSMPPSPSPPANPSIFTKLVPSSPINLLSPMFKKLSVSISTSFSIIKDSVALESPFCTSRSNMFAFSDIISSVCCETIWSVFGITELVSRNSGPSFSGPWPSLDGSLGWGLVAALFLRPLGIIFENCDSINFA